MSHTSPISDMQFGPDGRRLFTSSFDGTIRVWDVPTGLCVDWSESRNCIYFVLIRKKVGDNSVSP
jgi:WD40 repeat protein